MQKLFYLWEGGFLLFDLQTVCLSIFRLLPSGFWPLPVCRIDWKRQACDGNTLIGQSILPTNESGPITRLVSFSLFCRLGAVKIGKTTVWRLRGNSLKIKEKKASLSQIKEFLQFFNDATLFLSVQICSCEIIIFLL